jgi:hypothetical protein
VSAPAKPHTLTHMRLPVFNIHSFPPSLQNLELVHRVKENRRAIQLSNLPPNLTHFKIGPHGCNMLDDLPSSLTILDMSAEFASKVPNHLPNLTQLLFPVNFNSPVSNLPPSLTAIQFGMRFNQAVDKLPPSLITLTLKSDFNQPVDHLPSTLQNLTLGRMFNHPLDHLPSSLFSLSVLNNSYFNYDISKLPRTLRTLKLDCEAFKQSIDSLPPSLTYLSLCHPTEYDDLTYLLQNEREHKTSSAAILALPPKLCILLVNSDYKHPLPPIPQTLEREFLKVTRIR